LFYCFVKNVLSIFTLFVSAIISQLFFSIFLCPSLSVFIPQTLQPLGSPGFWNHPGCPNRSSFWDKQRPVFIFSAFFKPVRIAL
jgi:hypothetical protein